jgi:hypothetical protein
MLLAAVLAAKAVAAAGPGYDQLRAAAVNACEVIAPDDYQTGLFFNPDGYRSYYVQSECFQRVAVEFRDDSLCASVRERRAWLSSSWGYSEANCRKLTAAGVSADEQVLNDVKQRYQQGAVTLRDFRVEPNGNGRDFDFIPEFTGAFAHRYSLQFEVLDGDRGVVVDRSEFHLDASSNIRVFVRGHLLRGLVEAAPGHTIRVRATLTLEVGQGTPSGRWSEAFIERVFPARERSQSIVREARFAVQPA